MVMSSSAHSLLFTLDLTSVKGNCKLCVARDVMMFVSAAEVSFPDTGQLAKSCGVCMFPDNVSNFYQATFEN